MLDTDDVFQVSITQRCLVCPKDEEGCLPDSRLKYGKPGRGS